MKSSTPPELPQPDRCQDEAEAIGELRATNRHNLRRRLASDDGVQPSRPRLLYGSLGRRRDRFEQGIEPLGHRRMRENGVTEHRVR
jgi:hypothetical protein